MENPWKNISLSDYENHMKLDTVMQLQTLKTIMKKQLDSYPVDSVMILGIAGGNGLENVDTDKYNIVYGVDINPEYLKEAGERYCSLGERLKLLCIDIVSEHDRFPCAEFIIADLIIEYIGYEVFQTVIRQVEPKYVSCGIQVDTNENFASDSPYLHSFDGLNSIHHCIEADKLSDAMRSIGYYSISEEEYELPNGKKLIKTDYMKK